MEYEWQGMPGEGAMRQGGGGGRASSPPRGALAGIRRDAKASSVTGATPLPSGGAWSNCAWRSLGPWPSCVSLSPSACNARGD
jgi:hypothetical protein